MSIRIIQDNAAACAEADYLRISACCDPDEDTLTLTTIQRIVLKPPAARRPRATHWIKTLLARQPMSADEAIVLATRYAERKRIPVIVQCGTQAEEEMQD